MTRKEFRDYVIENNCSIVPVDGNNITGQSVKITNNKFLSEYTYKRLLPINDWDLPDRLVKELVIN